MNEIQQAILKTLCYGEVFDYPLTFQQLHTFLISQKKVSKKDLKKSVQSFPFVKKKGNYFYLKGKSDIVSIRLRREKESINKIRTAKKIAKILSLIPSIQLIGLSGSVALRNCEKNHDIDLFIVTKANTLWISRFFVMTLLFCLQKRRKPYDTRTQNKICANMFVTTNTVRMPVSRRNIYTAHEIVQVSPLINKKNTYQYFLSENKWVKNFLANSKIPNSNYSNTSTSKFLKLIDTLYFYFQYIYMRKKITTEYIQKDSASFHPGDYKTTTIASFRTKYRHYQNYIATMQKKALKNDSDLASRKEHLASIFTPGS